MWPVCPRNHSKKQPTNQPSHLRSTLQPRHGANAVDDLPRERRDPRPVPRHVHQLSARHSDGGRLVLHVRADEADAQPGHGHEDLSARPQVAQATPATPAAAASIRFDVHTRCIY